MFVAWSLVLAHPVCQCIAVSMNLWYRIGSIVVLGVTLGGRWVSDFNIFMVWVL